MAATDTHPAGTAPAALSHREILRILGGLMLGMLLAALDQTIVATALPSIARDLHGIAHMAWVISAYLLTSTAATPIYGKLSDFYGRRALLMVAIGIFLVASVLCALSQTMTELILARAAQGIGGGGLISLAHATIADVIAPRDRGRYQGYFSAVFAASSVAGPVLGGFFSDHLSWHWVFWINVPIGAAALVVSSRALKKLVVHRTEREIDYPGAILLVAAVTALLLVTSWGGVEYDWTSPVILGVSALGLALLLSLWLRERLARDPILPLRLFRSGVYSAAIAMSFLTAMAMFGGIVFLPLFLQLVSGETASASGVLLIPFTGGTVVGAYLSGRLVSLTGRYKVFPVVGLGVAVGTFVFLARMDAATAALTVCVLMVLLGIGIGMVLPVQVVTIQNAIDLRDLGAGSASVSFYRSLGGSFGVALLGSVLLGQLDRRIAALPGHALLGAHPALDLLHGDASRLHALGPGGRAALVDAVSGSFTAVFLIAGAMAALALVAAILLRELPLRTTIAAPAAPTE